MADRMAIEKAWVTSTADPEAVLAIASSVGISKAMARFLCNRGLTTPEAALEFINADFDLLDNPFKMPDMSRAVDRLLIAKKRGETVFVAGDRDTDGVTSTTLLVNLLELDGIAYAWRVPSGSGGYGLTRAAVDAAAAARATLIIAVDCGIRDFDGASYAAEKRIDVIVLDHHEPDVTLPRACAVVDPKRADCAYAFTELSACGVAFRFAQAYLMAQDESFYNREMVILDIETSGTSAANGEIVELAGVKAVNGVETARFISFIRPEKLIPASYTDIHGITNEMVADAPPAEQVLRKFREFIGDAVLVAHNASFDVGFVGDLMKRTLGIKLKNDVIDTLKLARQLLPGVGHSLGALTKQFEISHAEKHRALGDVLATLTLYKRLVARQNPKVQAFLKNSLDLVTLSTLADVVPLVSENRVLVRRGLEALKKSTRPGIVALRDGLVKGDSFTAKDVAWSITPVINAAGRLGRAQVSAELLMAKDSGRARELMAQLVAMNEERKELEKINAEVVNAELIRCFDPGKDTVAVVAVSNISRGVTGIVANKILHRIGRPIVILIEGDDGLASGTARSIRNIDITQAFARLTHLIERYGGHAGACSVAVKSEKVAEFRISLNEFIRETVPPEKLRPTLEIDAELNPSEVNDSLVKEIELIQPTGHGNPAPLFCIRDAEVADARRMGDGGKHLKLGIRSDAGTLEMVAWNVGDGPSPSVGDRIDVAFEVEKNSFRGRSSIQCLMQDLRITKSVTG